MPRAYAVTLHLLDQPLTAETESSGGLLLIVSACFECLGDHPSFESCDRTLQRPEAEAISDCDFGLADMLRQVVRGDAVAPRGDKATAYLSTTRLGIPSAACRPHHAT
jgi:hypothetical protein